MKKTIVLLGVGSTYFTKGIVESLIHHKGEWDLRMVDPEPHCLDIAMKLGKRLVDKYEAPIILTGSMERTDVLAGADAVVSTIGVGGRKAWAKDMLMFREFGIFQTTGDTYGAGGVSRALRTVPVLVSVARDMERLCPSAILFNFSNPMTVNCQALSQVSTIKTVGLCYGITYFQHFLANFIDVPFEATWAKAIGTNHFSWITDFRHEGRDAWPMVHDKMKEKASIVAGNPQTWELFETFGAFPVVGDGHICEFIPGFLGEGAYYGKTVGVDAMHNAVEYLKHWDDVFADMEAQANGLKDLDPLPDFSDTNGFRDEDLFIDVLTAWMGEKSVERTVNLPNAGQVSSLPRGAVLEGTTLVNGAGFHPLTYGELPKGINAILMRVLGAQALTVEAALKADRKLVVQSLMADLTAIRKADAEKIADCILETHREYLPAFHR